MSNEKSIIGSSHPDPREQLVAVLDILGFKRVVETNPLDEILLQLRNALRAAELNSHGNLIDLVRGDGKGYSFRFDEVEIRVCYFSDTLLCWSDTDKRAIRGFFMIVSKIIAVMNFFRFPIRGGISVGQCVIDEDSSIYLGMPIIEAATVEKRSYWAGVGLHPTCHSHPDLSKYLENNPADITRFSVPEKPPCKNVPPLNMQFAVNWPLHFDPLCLQRGDNGREYRDEWFTTLLPGFRENTARFYTQCTGHSPNLMPKR